MRILLVSYYFPPYNTMGAVRVGKMAKYLTKSGHEVRVLTCGEQYLPSTLPLEIPERNVIRTRMFNPNRIFDKISNKSGRGAVVESSSAGSQRSWRSLAKPIYKAYQTVYTLTAIPDRQVGWVPHAIRAGRKLLSGWRPDIIYSSGLPASALIVANRLSKEFNIPYVGELRDLWTDNPYARYPLWRKPIESSLERRTISRASGIVTVSELWANTLREKHQKPTLTIPNGYDPDDYEFIKSAAPDDDSFLRIVHTGTVYEGKRDPTPLFIALQQLDRDLSQSIRVSFYGRYLDWVKELAKKYGVLDRVEFHDPVDYRTSLTLQAKSDILLLLLWDHPSERGVYTGKFYEYIAARRPILCVGPRDNPASRYIVENEIGASSTRSEEISDYLATCVREKRTNGSIKSVDLNAGVSFTRSYQAKLLEEFMVQILDSNG